MEKAKLQQSLSHRLGGSMSKKVNPVAKRIKGVAGKLREQIGRDGKPMQIMPKWRKK